MTDYYVDAFMRLKVPKHQIGKVANIYFPDSMQTSAICSLYQSEPDKSHPVCIDCDKKMDEIRRAYDKLMERKDSEVILKSDVLKILEEFKDDIHRTLFKSLDIKSDLDDGIYSDAVKKVNESSTVYLQPKHGKWIDQNEVDNTMEGYYECSECKEIYFMFDEGPLENNYKFCPNCGADMREETHDETDN